MRTLTLSLALALTSFTAVALYIGWADERTPGLLLSDLRPLTVERLGDTGAKANLLGISTRMLAADYQSAERLHLKFATHLTQARNEGLLGPRTLVVLPEHVGTGLFAVGQKPEVQQARTLRDAMQWMAMSNPLRYLQALANNRSKDRRTEAVLRMKAENMANLYQSVFSRLAREFHITLVAGSIVLPEPKLLNGRLLVGDGPLRQVSLAFGPDGEALPPLLHKQHLSRYEKRYSEALPQAEQPVVRTPAGSLALAMGCPQLTEREIGEIDVLAIIGLPDAAECQIPMGNIQILRVDTLGMPWNLLGSPKKPAQAHFERSGKLQSLGLPQGH